MTSPLLESVLLDREPTPESFLQSLCDQVVTVAGKLFRIAANELICTEHSHKYMVDGFAQMAAKAGLTLRKQWTHDEHRFAVLHFAIVDYHCGAIEKTDE